MKLDRKSWMLLLMEACVLGGIGWAGGQRLFTTGWTPNAIYFTVVAVAWFAGSVLISRGARRFNWSLDRARVVMVMVGAYVLVLALGHANGSGSLAVRVLAAYCFVAVYAVGPGSAVWPALTGNIAYVNFFISTGAADNVSILAAAFATGCAVLCAWAWRAGIPIIWHTARSFSSAGHGVWTSSRATLEEASGSDSRGQALQVLLDEKTALLEQEQTAGLEVNRKVESLQGEMATLKQRLSKSEAALKAAVQEKTSLAKELAQATDELEKVYGNLAEGSASTGGAVVQAEPAAAAGESPLVAAEPAVPAGEAEGPISAPSAEVAAEWPSDAAASQAPAPEPAEAALLWEPLLAAAEAPPQATASAARDSEPTILAEAELPLARGEAGAPAQGELEWEQLTQAEAQARLEAMLLQATPLEETGSEDTWGAEQAVPAESQAAAQQAAEPPLAADTPAEQEQEPSSGPVQAAAGPTEAEPELDASTLAAALGLPLGQPAEEPSQPADEPGQPEEEMDRPPAPSEPAPEDQPPDEAGPKAEEEPEKPADPISAARLELQAQLRRLAQRAEDDLA
ncbi:MAG: hypothetical protein JXR37_07795 [Kiritimatiellae bacterium]|nr:hypothetical protein [Kiritimatiellia bacterium]